MPFPSPMMRVGKRNSKRFFMEKTVIVKIKMAEAAFAGKGEEEFDKIIAEANAKWAAKRDEVLG